MVCSLLISCRLAAHRARSNLRITEFFRLKNRRARPRTRSVIPSATHHRSFSLNYGLDHAGSLRLRPGQNPSGQPPPQTGRLVTPPQDDDSANPGRRRDSPRSAAGLGRNDSHHAPRAGYRDINPSRRATSAGNGGNRTSARSLPEFCLTLCKALQRPAHRLGGALRS